MIASLTFTYGNDRHEIFRYKNNDLADISFRSQLGFNLYLFHNSSSSYIDKIKQNTFLKMQK